MDRAGVRLAPSRPTGAKTIPAPRKMKYFDDKGRLRPELLDGEAEAAAQAFASVSSTQLRRFYEHVLSLERRLRLECDRNQRESEEEVFARLRPEVKMLKAKAIYAKGRDGKLPEHFVQFFVDHDASIETARDFEAFKKHFEAVVAFHKFFGKD
jgi:CRISPR type III-A/MTUBE-associated protein Csm2